MRGRRPWIVLGGGAVLVVVGLVLFVVGDRPEQLGWTAYMPMDMPRRYADYVPTDVVWSGGVFVTPLSLLGASLAVVGLLVLVGLVGWLLGRRSSSGRVGG